MRLIDDGGHGVDIRVTGYQFPDAVDPRKRHSWHMVEGTVTCADGSWAFRFPALTCDESPRVSSWLRDVLRTDVAADGGGAPPSQPVLKFAEPNLSSAVTRHHVAWVDLVVGLDLEFSPPWRSRREAEDPFLVRCRPTRRQLADAADEWDEEIRAYPSS
jgi:hypothetical protein